MLLASPAFAQRRGEEQHAKYWPPVGRIDNVWGDRNLFCSCAPVNETEQETP